jgi:L-ascorbate metabolism protein UlaG (beta-lactamase superfamily)
MRYALIVLGACLAMGAASLASCSFYQPLQDPDLYGGPIEAPAGDGVTVTYFGNSTIAIRDDVTTLLVDGFFSRPGPLRSRFGKVRPDEGIIREQLALAGLGQVNAILVGHTHFDHVLDAPTVARITGAKIMGSRSNIHIRESAEGRSAVPRLIEVPPTGRVHKFGDFTVSFIPSEHVPPHLSGQEEAQGHIEALIVPPASATDYKHGDVFAIHISHPHGIIGVTTTAGARPEQFAGYEADVLMLAVGLLEKEPECRQEAYWTETVLALNPQTVIPIHWDNFTRKLDTSSPPKRNLRVTRLKHFQNARHAMQFVKDHSGSRSVWVMGLRDSFLLSDRQIKTRRTNQ